jgi:D-alanyl-D-alanine carboxypeptidase
MIIHKIVRTRTPPSAKRLIRVFSTLTLFLLISLVALTGGYGASTTEVEAFQGDEEAIEEIDEFLTGLSEAGDFSGAILIARGNDVLLSKGYGMANREWGNPNSSETVFQVGGLTVQFTAMAILLLQEQGALSVQDPICQYVEDCPDAWQDITIRHLLMHTSGIPDYVNFSDFGRTSSQATTPEALLERFKGESLAFDPGEDFFYSSSGYILLGLIIEEVSGLDYRTFLQDNFFEPLGMANTDLYRNEEIVENRAEVYNNRFKKASYIDVSNLYAAGGLYSTVEDLFIWTQALYGGTVISQDSWNAILADTIFVAGDVNYSYGIMLRTDHSGHSNLMRGAESILAYWPDQDVTIIGLSNLETQVFGRMSGVIAPLLSLLPGN